MQKEIAALRSQNKKAKIFMYMVIHDLKHPTESLINSVEQILTKFEDF
jgi:light-regulated signal transduction histidine kinase (bacteriophytochrome)